MHIGILGAGIVGFNTALRVQQELPNAEVTLIADKFVEDTTSYGAAGLFRPGSHFSSWSCPKLTKKWINDSYYFYDEILHSDAALIAGVSQVSGYYFSSKHRFLTRNPLIENLVPVYRDATEDELRLCPGNWKYGSYFTTMTVGSDKFLPWARAKFEGSGGRVICQKLQSFQDLDEADLKGQSGPFDVVFNCTGLGSKWLCNDSKLIPVRGQVMKVKAPWVKMFFYADYDTYVIPGQNTVTLGGSRQLDNYNTSICTHDSKAIWEKCTSLLPSLQKAEIVREWVGLRPHRGSVRCEMEEIPIGSQTQKLKIIHHYGHGGYGVTTSPGTAKYAVQILVDSLKGSSNGRRETPCYTPFHTRGTCYTRISKL